MRWSGRPISTARFAGALRRSELAARTDADLHWHAADGLHVRIRSSKTDQEGHGATVVLPFGEHPGTCPPCAWLRWTRPLAASHEGRQSLMRAVFATACHSLGQPITRSPRKPEAVRMNRPGFGAASFLEEDSDHHVQASDRGLPEPRADLVLQDAVRIRARVSSVRISGSSNLPILPSITTPRHSPSGLNGLQLPLRRSASNNTRTAE
jgi:hypothetical protein